MNLIKSKQIESLEADKIIQSDDLRFISKADLDNVKKLQNVDVETIETVLGDTVSQVDINKDKIEYLENNSHTHDNKSILSELSESQDGKLLYKGNVIEGGVGESVDLIPIKDKITDIENSVLELDEKLENVETNINVTINEMSNPLTTKPLEYGYFKVSNETTSVGQNTNIPFNTLVNGNMVVTSDGVVSLKQGKTYKILCDIYMVLDSAENVRLSLVNVDTNEELITSAKVPVSISGNYSGSTICGIITPQVDTKVAVRVSSALQNVYSSHSYLVIEEVRNNPVNQYGGFETEVLFDGHAGLVGSYSLVDDISNYNFLLVEEIGSDSNGDNLLSPMTSDTTPSPMVASASSTYSSSYPAFKAFDGYLSGEGWICQIYGGTDEWLLLDIGKTVEMNKIDIYIQAENNQRNCKALDVMVSTDGQTYETVANLQIDLTKSIQEVFLPKATLVRYIKFVVTEVFSTTVYTSIVEVKAYNIKTGVKKSVLLSTINPTLCGDMSVTFKGKEMIINKMSVVSKVTGIKGQIPSLLVGGKF